MPSTPSIRSTSDDSSSQKIDLTGDASDSKPTALPLDVIPDLSSSKDVSEEERKAERRLLWKLDLILLVWAWLAYVFKVNWSFEKRRPKG